MSGHTPEPWRIEETRISGGNMKVVDIIEEGDQRWIRAFVDGRPIDGRRRLAKHVRKCLNACTGGNPEAVPEMVEALKACVAELSFLSDASQHARAALAKWEGK